MEYLKETPCVAMLIKEKCHFLLLFLYKIREQESRRCSAWDGRLVAMGGRKDGEMVKEGEYGANTVHKCM
jgi:hypothetical protein